MQRIFEKLKAKWEITSNLDFFLIMVVFSLAGLMVGVVRKPLFHLFGISKETPFALKAGLYLLFVFPTYQLSLIVFGFLLGQFEFFWDKEKKLGRAILKIFKSG